MGVFFGLNLILLPYNLLWIERKMNYDVMQSLFMYAYILYVCLVHIYTLYNDAYLVLGKEQTGETTTNAIPDKTAPYRSHLVETGALLFALFLYKLLQTPFGSLMLWLKKVMQTLMNQLLGDASTNMYTFDMKSPAINLNIVNLIYSIIIEFYFMKTENSVNLDKTSPFRAILSRSTLINIILLEYKPVIGLLLNISYIVSLIYTIIVESYIMSIESSVNLNGIAPVGAIASSFSLVNIIILYRFFNIPYMLSLKC